ncbi:hypothetical protein KSP40_PGU014262 [Platanthera guangdongensis]|uniref:Uncharacterized protein n=1 Tax=Platanthera guangdongensis TaxID=2320717 RepID=A0ABR2MC90_9ASPA
MEKGEWSEAGCDSLSGLGLKSHSRVETDDNIIYREMFPRPIQEDKYVTKFHKFTIIYKSLIPTKDYDRDPAILREVDDFQVIVLCSSLQILPFEDRTEDDFRTNIKKLLHSSQKCLL